MFMALKFFLATGLFVIGGCDDEESFRKDQLADYYFCIDTREREIVKTSKVSPQLLVAVEGLQAVMPCVPCTNFAESEDWWANKQFYWKYRLWVRQEPPFNAADETSLKLIPAEEAASTEDDGSGDDGSSDDNYFKSTTARSQTKPRADPSYFFDEPYHTLFISSVHDHNSSGEYFCFDSNDTIMALYHLDVVPSDKYETVGLNPKVIDWNKDSMLYGEYGVEVVNIWTAWSSCNRCGYVAERRRYGMCTVRLMDGIILDKMQFESMRHLRDLFLLYPSGVPCRTSWLPLDVQNLTDVVERPNLIHVHFCMSQCKTEPLVRSITEKAQDGTVHVIEQVKRGRYSIREKIPKLPSPVVRVIREVNIGDKLSIFCPSSEERIFWMKGKEKNDTNVLSSALLYYASEGRMYLDRSSSLVFTEVTKNDEEMYSCWSYTGIMLMSAEVTTEDPAAIFKFKLTLILTALTIIFLAIGYVVWSVLRMTRS